MKTKGLHDLLGRAAQLLDEHAEEIFLGHSVRWKWAPSSDASAKRDYKKLTKIAKALRKAAKYHAANPLGGPASIFIAIHDRIQTGEDIEEVLADYGLGFSVGKHRK